MAVTYPTLEDQKGWLRIRITGIAAAAGSAGGVANPEGVPIFITAAKIHLITPAAAAATANIGVGASVVGDYSDLVAGWPMNGGADTWWEVLTGVASEAALTTPSGLAWSAANFLTVTTAAAASPAFVGDLYLQYVRNEVA